MIVTIHDDFSLSKIADSGQAFRVREFGQGLFRFVYREHILYMRQVSPKKYEVSCGRREWNAVWKGYFDLGTDYAAVRAGIPQTDAYLTAAAKTARGVRILRQDPWEMLVTFIISQRKSIPAIKGAVELLCERCGEVRHTPYEDVFLFPTPQALCGLTPADLAACKLGYRAPYVADAARQAASGRLDFAALGALSDEELRETLRTVKGVGDKVANCVTLFGYHRTASVPVDVWIRRVMDEEYGGQNPFEPYGENAGILQQFVFYGVQREKNEGKEKK